MKTELLKSQNNVENNGQVNSSSNGTKLEMLENTPFHMIWENNEEEGSICIGQYRMQSYGKHKTQKDAMKYIKKNMFTIMVDIASIIYKINNDKEV